MSNYHRLYRWGFTPWERYGEASAASVASWLDRESAGRPDPPGRALDLGCGRGLRTPALAERGWDTVGIDIVPQAIEAAQKRDDPGVRYVVGDVTDLAAVDLGEFDLFLDVGCFQGLDQAQRAAMGASVTASAAPGASLLMLAFGPTKLRRLVEGISQEEIENGFPAWKLVEVAAAPTAGLGWPMNRTSPQWYRLRRRNP